MIQFGGQPPPAVRASSGGQPPPAVTVARPAKDFYRRKLPHFQREGRTVFVTFATKARWVIPEALRTLVLGHCIHDHGVKLWVHAAVVMTDHVHLVFTPLSDHEGNPFSLAEILGGIKGSSAHTINTALGRKGTVWQAESWDRIVRSGDSPRTVAEYVCANPTRAGLAEESRAYPWLWREWVEGSPESRHAQPGAAVPPRIDNGG